MASFIYALCGPMPTDGPMPHPSQVSAVEAQMADPTRFPYHVGVAQAIMSRFQWQGHEFDIRFQGEFIVYPQSGGFDSFTAPGVTIPFDVSATTGTGMATVLSRFPSGSFTAGEWANLTSLTDSGTISIPGSHVAWQHPDYPNYIGTNYRLKYSIEVGAFANHGLAPFFFDEADVGGIHLYQLGDNYRIPFRVGVRFEYDVTWDSADPEVPIPPTTSGNRVTDTRETTTGTPRNIGGARVGNGDTVTLFDGGGDFGMDLWGYEEDLDPASIEYFNFLGVQIKASAIAAVPSPP